MDVVIQPDADITEIFKLFSIKDAILNPFFCLAESKKPNADKILEENLAQQPISSNLLSCVQQLFRICFGGCS